MNNVKFNKAYRVSHRIIQSGDVVELYSYEKPYLKGFEIDPDRKVGSSAKKITDAVEAEAMRALIEDREPETQEEIYIRSSKRAASKLVRIINSNANQYGYKHRAKFLTLTFADDITDLDIANKKFQDFIRRLNYYLLGERRNIIKYTAVWELTKLGRIHYHVVFYTLPFIKIDDLVKIWGNGIAHINEIKEVDNIGVYVAKYMSKPDERYMDPKYHDKKRYFSSTKLKKPLEIDAPEDVMDAIAVIVSSGSEIKYSWEFESEELGMIYYFSYIIPDLDIYSEIHKRRENISEFKDFPKG